jgi:hypothetical protein
MGAVTDELTNMAAAYRQLLGQHPSLYGFVLERGREYEPAPLPAGISRGAPRQCFQNALNIADDDGLVYTEGYMLRPGVPILVHHAWCVTPDGVVVDPTIPDPETCGYYGIEFQADWVFGLGYFGTAIEKYAARLLDEGRL